MIRIIRSVARGTSTVTLIEREVFPHILCKRCFFSKIKRVKETIARKRKAELKEKRECRGDRGSVKFSTM